MKLNAIGKLHENSISTMFMVVYNLNVRAIEFLCNLPVFKFYYDAWGHGIGK